MDFSTLLPASAPLVLGYVFLSLCLQTIYRKRYISGLSAWIPIWREVNFFRASGMSGLWVLAIYGLAVAAQFLPKLTARFGIFGIDIVIEAACLLSIAVIAFIAAFKLTKALSFHGAMSLLSIFLPPIWLMVLAISNREPEYED